MKRAVFRADASPRIGGGHVMRCLTLADALKSHGWQCGFDSGTETLDTVPALGRSGHGLVKLDQGEAIGLLVVDHYELDGEFEKSCRPFAQRIMVLDDLADRAHDCDVLLDQTFGRDAADYASLLPDGCTVLTGSTYALLRPMFSAARKGALDRRATNEKIERILVNLGSTDPDNVTSEVLKNLSGLSHPVKVDVVLGGNAPHLDQVRALAESGPMDIEVHVDCEDMATLIGRADVAIGAAGSSSWERCCLGLPTLMIVIADNQRLIAAELANVGAAINLGPATDLGNHQIAMVLEDLMNDPERLKILGSNAAALCDGHGVERLIDILIH